MTFSELVADAEDMASNSDLSGNDKARVAAFAAGLRRCLELELGMIRHFAPPSFKLVLMDLKYGPANSEDLASAANVCRATAQKQLVIAHRLGMIHVIGWERRRGRAMAVYELGPGEDKKRPRRLTEKERRQRYLEKKARRLKIQSSQPTEVNHA